MKSLVIYLVLLSLSLTACVIEQERSERFKEGRKKTNKTEPRKPRRPKPPLSPSSDLANNQEEPETTETSTPLITTTDDTESPADNLNPQQQEQQSEEEPETFSYNLPIGLAEEHTSLSFEPYDDYHERMIVRVEPRTLLFHALAGIEGTLSIRSDQEQHILTISSDNKSMEIFVNKKANLLLEEGAQVEQNAVLAETTHPIAFSVKINEQYKTICIAQPTGNPPYAIIKDFENHPACP